MKITLSKVFRQGLTRWMIYYHPPGAKRKRLFFTTKTEAEQEQDRLKAQQDTAGNVWLSLSGAERNGLIQLHRRAIEDGETLAEAYDFYRSHKGTKSTISLGAAFDAFMIEKRTARLSKKTTDALKSNVGRFVRGRSEARLTAIGRADIVSWLAVPDMAPRTFNSYLTSVKTFFGWCVAAGHVDKSPAEKIAKIGFRQMPDIDEPPAVLRNKAVAKLMRVAQRKDPALLPYLSVCLFAGIRPDGEASKLSWADIQNGVITVRGLHAKSRQRREVPITGPLQHWLALGGDLPVKNRRRRFEAVRRAAGLFKGWKQDYMRHTFASNYFATHGAEKTIAALGHGDYDMLFRHYRDIVGAEAAAQFWAIAPTSPQSEAHPGLPSRGR